MVDEIDRANDLIDSEISSRLRGLRSKGPVAPGPEHCEECGETVPMPRREMGFALCVQCAEETERREALFARSS